jgi:3',5'-cyclic AMP phosphodiesterase CpdA
VDARHEAGHDGKNMFTLAHLSDPHLAPLPQPRWSELIGKRITGYINWQRKRRFIHDPAVLARIVTDTKAQAADHIAVTGDIANIGLAAEYRQGRDWLEGLGPARDVTFVPGNHDIYVRESAVFAARQWGAYMCDDDGVGGFPFVRRRGNVAVIGLSSGVPTAPFLATGWLGATQFAELAITLNKLRKEDVFRVVLIHHPPVSKAAQQNLLMDARILLRVIATHGADLLLHGHDHIHMINWLDGPEGTRVPAVGVPSASATPAGDKDVAAYNLYRIDGTRGAWQCELISRGLAPSGEVTQQKRFMLLG